MKRTPLNRKTPMPPRTEWMPRVSKKRSNQLAYVSKPRKEFKATFRLCMLCNKRKAHDVHEIVTRAKSGKSVEHRCTWLCLCRTCHDQEVSDYSKYPISRQLALKLVADPEAFDLAKVCELRGNDPNEFTMADVSKWLRMA